MNVHKKTFIVSHREWKILSVVMKLFYSIPMRKTTCRSNCMWCN